MEKVISADEALKLIHDGDVVLIGGFLHAGGPNKFIKYMIENSDIKDLTIAGNDSGVTGKDGISQLVYERRVKKVIASHVGTNKETGRLMATGEMEVELVPQGTLAERIRAAGYGLGGVLTPTGTGIEEVEEGKEKIEFDGKEYLLEKPLFGDVALLNCYRADKFGNMQFKGSTRNFNTVMAFAGKTVIVEADEVVEVGEINQNDVDVPGILVDYIVDGSLL